MALAALLLAAPAAPPTTVTALTVPELVLRHRALVGRTVRVRGRLVECEPLSCGLVDDQRFAAPIAWLSFAEAPAFDATTRALVGRQMIVEGVVTNRCWAGDKSFDGLPQVPCTDRAPQFRPLRIVAVLDGSTSR